MVLGVAVLAVVDHRDRRSLVAASFGAVALVVFQAWLGRETVRLGNSGASVTAHLAAAMAVAGLLTFLLVRAGYPARLPGRGGSQRFTILAAFTAVATFAMLIFGANVTAADAALDLPGLAAHGRRDRPAVRRHAGRRRRTSPSPRRSTATSASWSGSSSRRRGSRPGAAGAPGVPAPTLFGLVTIAAVLYPLQAVVGALQVWTQLAPWTQTLHVALAAFIWVAAVGAAFVSYYGARAWRSVPAP